MNVVSSCWADDDIPRKIERILASHLSNRPRSLVNKVALPGLNNSLQFGNFDNAVVLVNEG